MKTTYDTDSILYKILKASEVAGILSGNIYAGDRPDDSDREDITVNTIALTQDYQPQAGVSNVNIHVSDIEVQIGGIVQKKENRDRLSTITQQVLQVLKDAKVKGLSFRVINQSTVREPELSQHFVNLRIDWSIHE